MWGRQIVPLPSAEIANARVLDLRAKCIWDEWFARGASGGPNGMEVAMLSSLFQSSTIPVLEQVVNFTEARHGILAGNIANLDTPGYRTRDLSPTLFQERLQEAIDTRHQPSTPNYGMNALGSSSAGNSIRRADRELRAFNK